MFRFAFTTLLVTLTAHTIALTALAQTANTSSETKTIYRILYRNGTQWEWREAIEAGSPVESEDKAIELAKFVKEKFDEGRLAAFEIEIHKIRILTRPATDEESQVNLPANTDSAPSNAGPSMTGSSGTAKSRPHKPITHDQQINAPTATGHLPAAVEMAETQVVPVEQPHQLKTADNTSSNATSNSDAPRISVNVNANDTTEQSPELVMDENTPRVTVQNNVRLILRDGSSVERTEVAQTANAPKPGSADAIDAWLTRLVRETQVVRSDVVTQPVVAITRVVPLTSSLDPDFFNTPIAPPSRPLVARRIRVIRNGQEVSRKEYDGTGTRIQDSQPSDQQSIERPEDNDDNKSASQQPEGTLVFDENAQPSERSAAVGADDPDAAALQKDREALQARKADLDSRLISLEKETQRLDSQRDVLAKEDQSLKSRTVELKSRERKLAAPGLVGRTGTGTYGRYRFNVEFFSGGRASVNDVEDANAKYDGTWSLSGDKFTLTASESTFTGTLSGNTIAGSRSRADGLTDSWSATLTGSSPESAEAKQKLAQEQRKFESDSAAHDKKHSSHQQEWERHQADRRQFQTDQNQYESEFAKHRQQTVEFNSRQE